MANRTIKSTLKDVFSFSHGERNGIIILFFCILATSIFRFVYPFSRNNFNSATDNRYLPQMAKLENLSNKRDSFLALKKNNIYNQPTQEHNKTIVLPKVHKIIELNSTDTIELDELPGIGPAFARRIIKYRDLLGGYFNKNQVLEVYGMKPENFKMFEKFIRVDTLLIKGVYLNTGTFKEINAHPYISFDQTKAIFHYRNKGLILSTAILKNNNLFDSIEIKKLTPYLNFK